MAGNTSKRGVIFFFFALRHSWCIEEDRHKSTRVPGVRKEAVKANGGMGWAGSTSLTLQIPEIQRGF